MAIELKILGISAKKQGGKTTAVSGLMSDLSNAVVIPFAAALKEIVGKCFIPPDYNKLNFDSDDDKNRKLPCGRSVRQLLQIVGTDMFRHLWKEVWINAWRNEVLSQPKAAHNILVPDVRFPNEVRAIQDMGGHVIRLLRAPFKGDTHESETALDFMTEATMRNYRPVESFPHGWDGTKFDYVLDNTEMSIPEQQQNINTIVRAYKWLHMTPLEEQ